MTGTLAKVAVAGPFSDSELDAGWAVPAQLVIVPLQSMHKGHISRVTGSTCTV